ncbi:TPA: phage portal protein, partial [Corynebacterium striatum]|nr:phage portal protein [Corynebacterium striatum]HAT1385279.1 phage portal protein [Corynebacterium striatum]HAT6544341.1 phage portal protein [Corynebacterium striatum]
ENLDRIAAADGGDLYLVNGNMLPLSMAGAYATTQRTQQDAPPGEEQPSVEQRVERRSR